MPNFDPTLRMSPALANPPQKGLWQRAQEGLMGANQAVKDFRESHPALDMAAGMYPPIAIAQMANDVTTQPDGDTLVNLAQAVPWVKKVNMLHKGAQAAGYGVDMAKTAAKNAYLTSGQVLAGSNRAE